MNYTHETHTRSLVRSIIWRMMSIVVLALITYLVTHSWMITTMITVLHHGASILGYYLHERFWLHIDKHIRVRARSVCRVVLYELVGSFLVLGTISWLVTGKLEQASWVTALYVGNKVWMYLAYDQIWGNINWGKEQGGTNL